MNIVSIAITIGILLAWLVPLIIGIKLLRGPQRSGGIALIVLGVIWAIPSLATLVLGTIYYNTLRSGFEVKDFNAATYHGATGLVRTGCPGPCKLTAKAQGANASTRYSSTDGAFALPVGQHRLGSLAFSAPDAGGKEWTATSKLYQRKAIEVSAQAPVQVQTGPPYQAAVKAQSTSKATTIVLMLTDCGGHDVSLARADVRPPPPQFQIIGKDHRVLFTGKFAYG